MVRPDELVIRYSTAPYDPDINLQVPGQVGFYNAYNEKTQLFLTHRNIDQLDLQLYAVPTDNFITAITEQSYDPASNYTPDPDQLLRQNTPQCRRQGVGLHAEIDQGGYGMSSPLGVKRCENQVTRKGGTYRNLSRLGIAYLTHQDDIGIMAKNTSQEACKGVSQAILHRGPK